MYRWARISTTAACLALAFGCDEQTEVQRQTRDLQEAQKNIGKVTQELESELEKSKADVIRLEQKLAMARQGITDDVLENQKELQEALKAQEQKVQSELGEAKREAQIHNRDTEAALKQLGQATAPPAEEVAPPVEGAPQPPVTPTDMPSRDDMVPVRGGPDREPDAPAEIDRGVTPAPTPAQPVDPTGAVPPPPPVVPPATSTTTSTTKSTTTAPASPNAAPAESSPPSAPPPGDMPPPPAPPAQ